MKAADAEGTIEAIVAVFGNVDLAGERILSGAFSKSLSVKLPKGIWMHNTELPVAKTIEARELEAGDALLPDHLKDLGGLYVKAQFNLNTQRGKDAYEDLKFGTVDEFSIGYQVLNSELKEGVRELTEIELYEWSPVLVAANRATSLLSMKKFDDHVTTLDSEVKQLFERICSRVEMREKAGRVLSLSNTTTLKEYAETCIKAGKAILDLVEKAQPEKQHELRAKQLLLQLKLKGLLK